MAIRWIPLSNMGPRRNAPPVTTSPISPAALSMTVTNKIQTQMDSVSATPNEPMECSHCQETFESVEQLATHLTDETIKIPIQSRRCILCSQSFAISGGNKRQPIKNHMYRHMQKTKICEYAECNYIGATRQDVVSHMKHFHGDEKEQQCYCGFMVMGREALKEHVEHVHVERDQIVGFVLRAGFDVGMLIAPRATWMAGRDVASMEKHQVIRASPPSTAISNILNAARVDDRFWNTWDRSYLWGCISKGWREDTNMERP